MAQQTDNPFLNPALTATLPTQQRGKASESAAPAIALPFSEKYNRAHSQQYFDKHRATLSRRLSNWRETQLARAALRAAGDPASVLDLPCGAGRFWPMLSEKPDRRILAADNSVDMIAVAHENQPAEISHRVEPFQTSAFAIDLPDNAVETVFSIRLLHHLEMASHRLAMLREFHRVASNNVIVSLWVDGNYKAWRRHRLERRRPLKANTNRFVLNRRQAEAEFREAGFDIVTHLDFVPMYAMWRTYVLRKRT